YDPAALTWSSPTAVTSQPMNSALSPVLISTPDGVSNLVCVVTLPVSDSVEFFTGAPDAAPNQNLINWSGPIYGSYSSNVEPALAYLNGRLYCSPPFPGKVRCTAVVTPATVANHHHRAAS